VDTGKPAPAEETKLDFAAEIEERQAILDRIEAEA
jgi:hypothetical protein